MKAISNRFLTRLVFYSVRLQSIFQNLFFLFLKIMNRKPLHI